MRSATNKHLHTHRSTARNPPRDNEAKSSLWFELGIRPILWYAEFGLGRFTLNQADIKWGHLRWNLRLGLTTVSVLTGPHQLPQDSLTPVRYQPRV
ncbi:unnamed protein product [Protopolystoma xenopodis]|uniref:Uncharacterized protein n=1 Tax=Protopolystoma xenopodis TaxID=117903 RepID=A0A448XFD8_9PLAT|nr:unnamed protein product [Protopolystoma xenopodis]